MAIASSSPVPLCIRTYAESVGLLGRSEGARVPAHLLPGYPIPLLFTPRSSCNDRPHVPCRAGSARHRASETSKDPTRRVRRPTRRSDRWHPPHPGSCPCSWRLPALVLHPGADERVGKGRDGNRVVAGHQADHHQCRRSCGSRWKEHELVECANRAVDGQDRIHSTTSLKTTLPEGTQTPDTQTHNTARCTRY